MGTNDYERCGNCKDFYLKDKTSIFGSCQSLHSRAKNKDTKTMLSRACYWQRRKDD